jgi:5-enolpyruvylshikimate-3-phosphate synthase
MAYAVAGLASSGEVTIDRFEAIDVSYPGFPLDLDALLVGGATG